MESNLEQLVEKSTKVRESLSRTLMKNFPIERDFADFLAMDVVNQAIGVDTLERYNESKRLEKVKQQQELKEKQLRNVLGITFKGVIPSIIVLCLAVWAVMGIHSCATALPYPRTYDPIPEQARFVDTDRSSWRGDQVHGLSDANNLCLAKHNTTNGKGGGEGSSKTCIHRNKAESLNKALEQAVNTDFNGVVWNEPNSNGEVWEVSRNNYRFVIIATRDESFLDN